MLMINYTPRLEHAINIATFAHRNQKRKGSELPYIVNPFSTMLIASNVTEDEDVLIACLFHDIFEDVPEEYSRQQMTTEFGNRVVQMVEDVTKDDSIKDWRKRSDAYLDHVKQSPDESIIVCASDKISNISAVLSDYKKVGEELWDRFASSKTDQLWWYKSVLEIVESRLPKSILVKELATRIEKLNCIINP